MVGRAAGDGGPPPIRAVRDGIAIWVGPVAISASIRFTMRARSRRGLGCRPLNARDEHTNPYRVVIMVGRAAGYGCPTPVRALRDGLAIWVGPVGISASIRLTGRPRSRRGLGCCPLNARDEHTNPYRVVIIAGPGSRERVGR
jgi:hypothetical protein